MESPHHIRNMLTLACVALMLVSCNYGIRPEPAVSSLSIGDIDNRTHEPRLSDALRDELARQLLLRDIHVADGLENEISGTIESMDVVPLSERAGSIVKFSVSIKAEFTLRRGQEGTEVRLPTPLSYIVAFGSDVPLDSLYAMREEAVRRAVADLASDLAASAAMGR